MSLLLDALREAENNKKQTTTDAPTQESALELDKDPTLEDELILNEDPFQEKALTLDEDPYPIETPTLEEELVLDEELYGDTAATLEEDFILSDEMKEEEISTLEEDLILNEALFQDELASEKPHQEEISEQINEPSPEEPPAIASPDTSSVNPTSLDPQPNIQLDPALNIFAAGTKKPNHSSKKNLVWLLLLLAFILCTGMALLLYWETQQQDPVGLTDDLILDEEILDEESSQSDSSVSSSTSPRQNSQREEMTTNTSTMSGNDNRGNKQANSTDNVNDGQSVSQQAIIQPPSETQEKTVVFKKSTIKIEKRTLSLSLSEKLKFAYNALQSGNYSNAKSHYVTILNEHPKQIDALQGLAKIYSHENNQQEARRLYERVLFIDDANTVAQLGLLHTYQEDESFERTSVLQELSSKYPENSQIAISLGHELGKQAKWLDAQKAYFKAFSLDPSNAIYAYNLAVSLDQLEKYSAAKSFYDKALDLNKQSPSALNTSAVKNRLDQLEGYYE